MTEPLQPGQHLSPDQLSAFAENVLPEHERLAALTHLSACADCRQVVFLAQQADPAPIATPIAETPRRGWFTLPQIFGAATAALACSLILALIVHFHPGQNSAATPITTAQVQPPSPIVPASSAPAAPAQGPAKQTSANSTHASAADIHLPAPPPPAKIAPVPTPQPVATMGADRATGTTYEAKAAAPKVQDKQSFAYDSVAGASANAAPMTVNGAMLMPAAPPAPPAPTTQLEARAPQAAKGARASSTSETVEVAAAPPMFTTENAAVATTIDTATIQDLPLNSIYATNLAKLKPGVVKPLKLPSKKPVASVLNAVGPTLALDTDGALFVSKDRGKHWTAVPTQWSGKAIQLSFAPTPARLYLAQPAQNQAQSQMNDSNSGAAMAAGVPQQQAPVPTAGFELTTATGAVWLSIDGLTWRPR